MHSTNTVIRIGEITIHSKSSSSGILRESSVESERLHSRELSFSLILYVFAQPLPLHSTPGERILVRECHPFHVTPMSRCQVKIVQTRFNKVVFLVNLYTDLGRPDTQASSFYPQAQARVSGSSELHPDFDKRAMLRGT
jgi:hypothetical protein